VTHDQVTAMVRDHMVKQSIISYPVLVECTSLQKEPEAKQFRYEATYDFIFVNAENPEDKISIRINAHAMDNADKAPGKALSYAKKYAILKLFEIETGDDEESRYQSAGMDGDTITYWIDSIKSLEGEPKKAAYKQAMAECARLKDVAAANKIKTAVSAKAE
jgi:hypothetical protein